MSQEVPPYANQLTDCPPTIITNSNIIIKVTFYESVEENMSHSHTLCGLTLNIMMQPIRMP